MPRKTITDTAIEVLAENGRENIWWGDLPMLDKIAARATHTNLLSLNPSSDRAIAISRACRSAS